MNERKLYTAYLAGTSYDGNKNMRWLLSQNGKIK